MQGKAAASAYFPLTKDNVRSQLPAVVHRFLWCTVQDLTEFRQIVTELYAPDAVFDFPTLRIHGRSNLRRFWTLFLFNKQLLQIDPRSFQRMDVTFDPNNLKLFLDMEVLVRLRYLSWLEELLGRPLYVLKIWSPHALEFRQEADGQLRIWRHEELANEGILLGLFVVSAFVRLRVDPKTPLGFVVAATREVMGWAFCMAAAALEWVLRVLGVQL